MRVQLNDPVAVGPTRRLRRDPGGRRRRGASAGTHRPRRHRHPAQRLQPGAHHPRRRCSPATPRRERRRHVLRARDRRARLLLRQLQAAARHRADPVSGTDSARGDHQPPAPGELAVATFNVENLDPATRSPSSTPSPRSSYATCARRTSSPSRRSRTTTARRTAARSPPTRPGPSWSPRSPRPAARLRLPADRPGRRRGRRRARRQHPGRLPVPHRHRASASSTGPAATPPRPVDVVESAAGGPSLRSAPGRIDPTNPAFANSRKPLAGEFRYRGETLFVVANHWNSKGGDDPLFGRSQPPVRSSETQRNAAGRGRGAASSSRVAGHRAGRRTSSWPGTSTTSSSPPPCAPSPGDRPGRPARHRCRARALHLRVRGQLAGARPHPDQPVAGAAVRGYDIVHVNSEFADQVSDHEPQVVRLLGASSRTPVIDPTPAGTPRSSHRLLPSRLGARPSTKDSSQQAYPAPSRRGWRASMRGEPPCRVECRAPFTRAAPAPSVRDAGHHPPPDTSKETA